MKCARCAAEIPGQAQFCMQCGTPVAASRPASSVTMARPMAAPMGSRSKTPLYLGIMGGLAALAAVLYFVLTSLAGSRVTEAVGRAGPTGDLVGKTGTVKNPGPLTESGQINAPTTDPVAIMDYLKHLKETERKRVTLAKKQVADVLTTGQLVQGSTLMREMGENPEEGHKQDYSAFQQAMSQWAGEWQELSRFFLSYPKPVPQSCVLLRDKYLDALGKTSKVMTGVASAFSGAMGGNPSDALQQLTGMRGSASTEVDQACADADRELAAVCDKFRITKDFDINPDGGGGNPYGVGR